MTDLPLSTSDLKQPVKIRMGKSGLSATPSRTILECFDETVAKMGDAPALYQKVVKKGQSAADVPFSIWSWKEYRAKVDAFGKSLLSLGFQPFDIINIIGFNSREWVTANFGAMAAGGVPAGIYTTNSPEACKYIASHSKAKVVVCEGVKQLEKFFEISKDLPDLKALVMYGPDSIPSDVTTRCSVPVYTFDSFLELGKDIPDSDIEARTKAWTPNNTCTLIYTSGTTGAPKAAMITHDNITWTVVSTLDAHPRGKMDGTDKAISYLPLSHIAAQMIDLHMPVMTGARLYFAQPDALKGTLVNTMREVRPTMFFGVPRVWEKMYDKLQEVARSTKGIKKALSTWAKKKASMHWDSLEFGSTSKSPGTYFLAKKLLHKAHLALGLDEVRVVFVAAAPIELKVLKYFASIDLPIMEIFGQSECTGPHTINRITAFKMGTVGRPLHGTTTKIDPETGELCYTGRHIFAGYMNMPDKTKEAIDPEGWLHSGDIAKIDDDNDPSTPKPSGFVSITGRIKELIITAGGENVPPVLIEEQFKLAMPALANCMTVGDRRKYLVILLCLQVEISPEGEPSNKLVGVALETSKKIGSDATTTDQVKDDPKWKEYFDKGMEKANQAATSRAQKVAKWVVLSTDFTESGGELTPTLKLKRKVAQEKHSDVIEAAYA